MRVIGALFHFGTDQDFLKRFDQFRVHLPEPFALVRCMLSNGGADVCLVHDVLTFSMMRVNRLGGYLLVGFETGERAGLEVQVKLNACRNKFSD